VKNVLSKIINETNKKKKFDSHQLLSAWEWNKLKHNDYEKKKQIVPWYDYLNLMHQVESRNKRKQRNNEVYYISTKCIQKSYILLKQLQLVRVMKREYLKYVACQ
jgi:hypothetical protein